MSDGMAMCTFLSSVLQIFLFVAPTVYPSLGLVVTHVLGWVDHLPWPLAPAALTQWLSLLGHGLCGVVWTAEAD